MFSDCKIQYLVTILLSYMLMRSEDNKDFASKSLKYLRRSLISIVFSIIEFMRIGLISSIGDTFTTIFCPYYIL